MITFQRLPNSLSTLPGGKAITGLCKLWELFGLLLSNSFSPSLVDFHPMCAQVSTQPMICRDPSTPTGLFLCAESCLPYSLENYCCFDLWELLFLSPQLSETVGLCFASSSCATAWRLPLAASQGRHRAHLICFPFSHESQSCAICFPVSENSSFI